MCIKQLGMRRGSSNGLSQAPHPLACACQSNYCHVNLQDFSLGFTFAISSQRLLWLKMYTLLPYSTSADRRILQWHFLKFGFFLHNLSCFARESDFTIVKKFLNGTNKKNWRKNINVLQLRGKIMDDKVNSIFLYLPVVMVCITFITRK